MTGKEFNHILAKTCQGCHAACCKQGKVFLPRAEHDRIVRFLHETPDALAAYLERLEDHGEFFLYAQRDRCQFLDERELCQLHPLGLKPTECFWWPYHVFSDADGELEVRVSTLCCDAYKAHGPDSPYPRLIARKVTELGPEMIQAFRRAFPGGMGTLAVGKVIDLLPPARRAPAAAAPRG